MALNGKGEPCCDSCPKVFGGSLEMALVLGWGHWKGQDHGGSDREYTICPKCRTIGHMRPQRPGKDFEDEPLF